MCERDNEKQENRKNVIKTPPIFYSITRTEECLEYLRSRNFVHNYRINCHKNKNHEDRKNVTKMLLRFYSANNKRYTEQGCLWAGEVYFTNLRRRIGKFTIYIYIYIYMMEPPVGFDIWGPKKLSSVLRSHMTFQTIHRLACKSINIACKWVIRWSSWHDRFSFCLLTKYFKMKANAFIKILVGFVGFCFPNIAT